jgi:hypothetical protein
MRQLESERAELRSEDITAVESVGNAGEPVEFGRHVDRVAVA